MNIANILKVREGRGEILCKGVGITPANAILLIGALL